ncbi:hypothetical protein NA56DRAFT_485991 [Hyaloscypha hepaticicola]|uniref:Uncharacterized protein n=1 Tax=Hyaloscypha hepaticicola TaxID=2082293 RepID=A0A2J6PE81_9HELO|nr:hypothetical protein NA56DRAFT_485991 [Hyaloscypha hepaticicola]
MAVKSHPRGVTHASDQKRGGGQARKGNRTTPGPMPQRGEPFTSSNTSAICQKAVSMLQEHIPGQYPLWRVIPPRAKKVVPSMIVETDCGESLIVQAFGTSLLVINRIISRYPRLKLIKFVGRDLSTPSRVGLAGLVSNKSRFLSVRRFQARAKRHRAGSQEPQVETTC